MPRTIEFVVSRETFFTSGTFKRIVEGNPPFAVALSAQTCTRQKFPPAAPRGAAAAYPHPDEPLAAMPRPPSISPELMTTFVTVVKSDGDATRAAELLNINQPSMSKRLAFLQHAGRILRRPWLERVGKSWHLTEEGRRGPPAVEELVPPDRPFTPGVEGGRPGGVFRARPGRGGPTR